MFKQPVNSAFDTYTLGKMIGEGGSGAVYEARNLAGDLVALKCLKANLATSKRKRFKNEVLFGQRCVHRNIVAVIDSGAASNGKDMISFYVMPHFPKTLRHLIEQGIPTAEILPLFAQLLDGVQAAHLLGVTHRDLKPENVLFDESSKVLVVADFGAAEFTEDELYTIVETKPGERIGNFQYAAPEQRKPGSTVDHRADIYSLGLILNEMYTGEVPAGTSHRQIASVSPANAYLDELVELMRRQLPDDRPGTINEIKSQLLARGNEFIELQRLNSLKHTVVPDSAVDEPISVQIRDAFHDGHSVRFVIEPKPDGQWLRVFQNLSSRVSVTSLMNRGPESVQFTIDGASIRAAEHEVPSAVRYFKAWVSDTNRLLPTILADQARQLAEVQRQALRRELEASEKRRAVSRLAREALNS